MGVGQGFANDARRFDKGDAIIIMLFNAGRDRKDVRVENDVFRRKVEFIAQEVIGAGTNLHLAVHGISLTQFVECHDDSRRAIAPHQRGLAAELNVSKPAITRALDRLGELDLARRKVDPMDRRSVIVQRTLKGTAFLRDMRQIMAEAETHPTPVPAEPQSGAEARKAG